MCVCVCVCVCMYVCVCVCQVCLLKRKDSCTTASTQLLSPSNFFGVIIMVSFNKLVNQLQ